MQLLKIIYFTNFNYKDKTLTVYTFFVFLLEQVRQLRVALRSTNQLSW